MKTGDGRGAATYLLQLPPEYRLGRNWPVLGRAAPHSGETPEDQLKHWSKAAGENGYILVAPEWTEESAAGLQLQRPRTCRGAGYAARSRRRFAVDSDRVFLSGYGQGGEMAFDVGLSHPDLFAGVLPMSAGPRKFGGKYPNNGQFLPFYMVDGDRSGTEMKKNLRYQFEKMGQPIFPMMWVRY